MMKVSEAKPGTVVVLLTNPNGEYVRGGYIYKIDGDKSPDGRIKAWRAYRQGPIYLYGESKCRDISNEVGVEDLKF